MKTSSVIAQLRTTDLERAIGFYTRVLRFGLEFRYQDFYAGIRAGSQVFHLKRVDDPDPSIAFVREGEHFHLYFDTDDVDAAAAELAGRGATLLKAPHDTPWGAREMVLADPDGHTLHFGRSAPTMRL